MKDLKILVACGGTGGHALPALSFLESLKSKYADLEVIVVVTRRKIEERIIPKAYKMVELDLLPFTYRLGSHGRPIVSWQLKNFSALLKLFFSSFKSLYIILKYFPDAVVGFGGYASFSLVFFARLLGIKTIIHEQNVIAGIANRSLARFADRIAVSFAQTQNCFKANQHKVVLTGNPIADSLFNIDKQKALERFGFLKGKFTILVMGGSQGSQKINAIFLDLLEQFSEKNNLQVIHLCGAGNYDRLLKRYSGLNISFKLFEFFESMPYAYCAADLAISRSGATTISELVYYRLPAVLIPYPFAYEHQIANAKFLSEKNAAILIKDSALNEGELKKVILGLFGDHLRLNQMRSNFAGLQLQVAAGSLPGVLRELLR